MKILELIMVATIHQLVLLLMEIQQLLVRKKVTKLNIQEIFYGSILDCLKISKLTKHIDEIAFGLIPEKKYKLYTNAILENPEKLSYIFKI